MTKRPERFSAVIVAGGRGVRMGRRKQLVPLCGEPMLARAIGAFRAVPGLAELIVVTDPEYFDICRAAACGAVELKTVAGGATRMESVRRGVAAVSPGSAVIAVHDGARPLVSCKAVKECVAAALSDSAAVVAVPVKDTIKTASPDGAFVASTPDRELLWAAQTPQCYRAETLIGALGRFPDDSLATDESQLVERAGVKVRLVRGEYSNIKVTTPEDIILAEALMKSDSKAGTKKMRSGIGFDIHRLVEGRPLVISGITLAHDKGLLGHSDGDVVLHSVCDAALGAVAAGEIGVYFPPTNMMIMGISSRDIAEKTLEILAEKNARLVSIDVIIIAEQPKMIPHYPAMKKALMEIFRLDENSVNVKAKSYEGMGDIGHGDAIACQAIATAEVG
ncbi:MAG: 2-C-methyl-D-erythritol 4-phosphate cytidylyltransferase [Elusimicrobiaceae bacterium]|nr:2-C-methyl-D-erythritol 4-phosphate cytidylyltransferase [Elusimicrobiaceae bacterium]